MTQLQTAVLTEPITQTLQTTVMTSNDFTLGVYHDSGDITIWSQYDHNLIFVQDVAHLEQLRDLINVALQEAQS